MHGCGGLNKKKKKKKSLSDSRGVTGALSHSRGKDPPHIPWPKRFTSPIEQFCDHRDGSAACSVAAWLCALVKSAPAPRALLKQHLLLIGFKKRVLHCAEDVCCGAAGCGHETVRLSDCSCWFLGSGGVDK